METKDDIDRILDDAEVSLMGDRIPFTARERELLRRDLERHPYLREWTNKNQRLHGVKVGANRYPHPDPLPTQIQSYVWETHDELNVPSLEVIDPRLTVTPRKGQPITARSFAAWWYLRQISSVYPKLWTMLGPAVWERDDTTSMELYFHRAFEYERFTKYHGFDEKDTEGLDLLFALAEKIYHPQETRYTGLADRIDKLHVDWRQVAV